MLKSYLQRLMSKTSLTREEAESAMEMMVEDADPHQTAAFLSILKYRGEEAQEVAGMAAALQKKAVPVQIPFPVMDIVGTGGDMAHTVNISTGSAILAAACGIPIAKHGNRSVSSRSGSADVLEALGIDIDTPPEKLIDYLKGVGIAFMYAPGYHPALKKLTPIRRGLKLPTVINLLGPLLNPAKAEYALIGVADEAALELMSQVIMQLEGRKRTFLFHGAGLDELTPLGKAVAYDIYAGQRHRIEIDPTAFGFAACSLKDLQGGDAEFNAALLLEALTGRPSAIADALMFTAGTAVWVFGKASSMHEGIDIARKMLKQGEGLKVLDNWKAFSKQRGYQ